MASQNQEMEFVYGRNALELETRACEVLLQLFLKHWSEFVESLNGLLKNMPPTNKDDQKEFLLKLLKTWENVEDSEHQQTFLNYLLKIYPEKKHSLQQETFLLNSLDEWKSNKGQMTYLNYLVKKPTNKTQKENITIEEPDRWDISLLSLILKNVVSNTLSDDEIAGIKDAATLRNDVSHNNKKLQLSEPKYEKRKNIFKDSMSKLSKKADEIEDLIASCEKIIRLSEIREATTWNDLYKSMQSEICNKFVVFQGKQVELKKLSSDLSNLDPTILYQLSRGEIPEIVKHQVPKVPSYYINRKLKCRTKLNLKTLKEIPNDWFVIENLDKTRFSQLVEGPEYSHSNKNQKFTLFESKIQFVNLCKKANVPVHWIKHIEGDIYEWVMSSGSLERLQKYVDESQDCIKEEDIASNENKVVIVSDSPGTGKTSLLAKISTILMNQPEHETSLVCFIFMKDFVQNLDNKKISKESISALISEKLSDFKFGKKLVYQILNSTKECVLVFDGLDEVLLNQADIALEVMNVAKSLDSVRVFVSTRAHLGMLEKLENTLHTFGYTIEPFDKSSQIEFMLSFWTESDKNVLQSEATRRFAEQLLKQLDSINDSESEIAGIPLQCYLLAQSNIVRAVEVSSENSSSYPSVDNISIFRMYVELMKIRLDKISKIGECHNAILHTIDNPGQPNPYEKVKNALMYFALKELFPEQADQFNYLNKYEWENVESLKELCKYGLLEGNEPKTLHFIHRTFAEYFVAWFSVERFYIGDQSEVDFILCHVLGTWEEEERILFTINGTNEKFNFPVVGYFINEFTKRLERHRCQLTNVSTFIKSKEYGAVSSIFYASLTHNYTHVPEAVTRFYGTKTVQIQTNAVGRQLIPLIHKAIRWDNSELLDIFCEGTPIKNLTVPDNFFGSKQTLMEVAFSHERKQIVEYLLSKCIYESQDLDSLLLWKPSASPGHWKCVAALIKAGKCFDVLDDRNNSLLHSFPFTSQGYSFAYIDVLEALSNVGFKHFNSCNDEHLTPLLNAAKYIGWINSYDLEAVLKIFENQNADINHADKKGNSVLCHVILNATQSQHSYVIVDRMIRQGAKLTHQNNNGENILHICAKHGKINFLTHILKEHKDKLDDALLKCKDKRGNTILHYLIVRSDFQVLKPDLYGVISTWLINNESVNATNNEGHTPFTRALFYGYVLSDNVISLLEQNGFDITSVAAETFKTAFYSIPEKPQGFWGHGWKVKPNYGNMLQYLLDKGGSLENKGSPEGKPLWDRLKGIIRTTKFTANLLHGIKNVVQRVEINDLQGLLENETEVEKTRILYEFVETHPAYFEKVYIALVDSGATGSVTLKRRKFPYYSGEKGYDVSKKVCRLPNEEVEVSEAGCPNPCCWFNISVKDQVDKK